MILKKAGPYISFTTLLLVISMIGVFSFCNRTPVEVGPSAVTYFNNGWQLRSSAVSTETGPVISSPTYQPQDWYPCNVPGTVLSVLVQNGVYKDIFMGKNLEKIPPLQFDVSWWYRTQFQYDTACSGARLIFEGINYSADIWLNGKKIAGADKIKGAFRMFDLDVTEDLKIGKNVLAVEIFPPEPGDFTIGFVDWNPAPPDKNMGLWRGVKLKVSGPVSVNRTFVQPRVMTEVGHVEPTAELTISSQLINHSQHRVSGVLKGEIGAVVFRQPYQLEAQERKTVVFEPGRFTQLTFKNPRLWWPVNMGNPELYQLEMTALADETVSDSETVTFGIRQVSDYINEQGYRGYKINGKALLIRGGGWVDDILLADSDEKLEAQFKYVKHMNLNTVRLEGFWGSSRKMYELADQYGILIMAGWSCQWEWQEYAGKVVDQFGAVSTPKEIELITRSLEDQILWLRNHPAVFLWVLGSDKLPRPQLEKSYTATLAKVDPTRPLLMSCKLLKSELSGSTAVKMAGPYDYVPPVYWYTDTELGGAFGFNTEAGPGPQPPPLQSLKKMIPADQLWPINDTWDFHCGRHEFNSMKRYLDAYNKRYGESPTVEDFAFKAQAANYEAMRGMFEAFAVNKPVTTGIIQWMLNSAWPELFWQLYDYHLMPNGAFYGAKSASQPLNIAYHYGNDAIYFVNDTLTDYKNLEADIRLLSLDSKTLFQKNLTVNAPAGASVKILKLPISKINGLSRVYFLDLRLRNQRGKLQGNNFYWLSTVKDRPDYKKSTWFHTPLKEYADFKPLRTLTPVTINASHRLRRDGEERVMDVTLENPTDKLAFFIHLDVVDPKTGQSILPVFWEDNYISLLPGETRTISARIGDRPGIGDRPEKERLGDRPVFTLTGWNVVLSNDIGANDIGAGIVNKETDKLDNSLKDDSSKSAKQQNRKTY